MKKEKKLNKLCDYIVVKIMWNEKINQIYLLYRFIASHKIYNTYDKYSDSYTKHDECDKYAEWKRIGFVVIL